MEEDHPYMMIVISSSPVVATRMVRSSTGKEYPAFNRRVVRSSRTGPTKICLMIVQFDNEEKRNQSAHIINKNG